jgi:hypothetical protein
MWKCKKCAESIEDVFDSCWQCGTPDDGTAPRFPAPSPVRSPAAPTSGSSPKLQHTLVAVGAATLCFSFFLPWVKLLGAGLNGLDIQKHFESYRLVWLMPVLAIGVLLLNLAGLTTGGIRRFVGLCPFAILAYAMSQLGVELLKEIQVGGWLALLAGAVLILIPSEPKTPR